MQQVSDFLEETNCLYGLVKDVDESTFEASTLFKSWSVNDILVHLHFWNKNAYASVNAPDEFDTMMEQFFTAIETGKLRPYENEIVKERGFELLELWYELSLKIADDFVSIDPKQRVKWAGPDMSARTCISARQMEVWAHGQAIFDMLGKARSETDRIKNIVVLGINAFGWSHQVHGLEVPDEMPFLKLRAPSSEVWEYGNKQNKNSIIGSAVEFGQVVAQTRNIADTSLTTKGDIAKTWMDNAQCFAGPPETPPPAGLRKKA